MLIRNVINRIINWLFLIWKLSHSGALLGVKKTCAAHSFFPTPNNASSWDSFHIKNNQLIILSFMYIISMFLKTMGVLSTIQLRVRGFCPRGFCPWVFCPGGGGPGGGGKPGGFCHISPHDKGANSTIMKTTFYYSFFPCCYLITFSGSVVGLFITETQLIILYISYLKNRWTQPKWKLLLTTN